MNVDQRGTALDQLTIPVTADLVRTSEEFDEHTFPLGFLHSHQVGRDVWGRIVVGEGSLTVHFGDTPDESVHVDSGHPLVLAPERLHRVGLSGPVKFVVELYRERSEA